MFRPNIIRSSLCRLHVGIKSTAIASTNRWTIPATTPTIMSTRHFASGSAMKPTTQDGGGSSFIPSSFLRAWYNTFGKSTAKYATFLVLMVVVGEYTFKGGINALWNMSNQGRTFETIDWGPFDEVDEDDEEEEEEEEDDDE